METRPPDLGLYDSSNQPNNPSIHLGVQPSSYMYIVQPSSQINGLSYNYIPHYPTIHNIVPQSNYTMRPDILKINHDHPSFHACSVDQSIEPTTQPCIQMIQPTILPCMHLFHRPINRTNFPNMHPNVRLIILESIQIIPSTNHPSYIQMSHYIQRSNLHPTIQPPSNYPPSIQLSNLHPNI